MPDPLNNSINSPTIFGPPPAGVRRAGDFLIFQTPAGPAMLNPAAVCGTHPLITGQGVSPQATSVSMIGGNTITMLIGPEAVQAGILWGLGLIPDGPAQPPAPRLFDPRDN